MLELGARLSGTLPAHASASSGVLLCAQPGARAGGSVLRGVRAAAVDAAGGRVAALDGGGRLQAAEGHQADVQVGGGWVRRFSRITGEAFFYHKASGRSQWEAP